MEAFASAASVRAKNIKNFTALKACPCDFGPSVSDMNVSTDKVPNQFPKIL
jgi:hypothetical protein